MQTKFFDNIQKAKVYVKNPDQAPPGVKLQTGKRGGQYYLSDDIERSPQKYNNIIVNDINQFKQQVDNMYKNQDVTDWQGDYMSELKFRGYFGNPQSFEVNRALRGGSKIIDERIKDTINKLQNGMNEHGLLIPSNFKLYRAVRGKTEEQLKNLPVGSSYRDVGFVSTTGVSKYASRFGKTLMEITVKENSKIKGLIYKDESEILLQPNRKFTITHRRIVNGNHIISVEVE